MSSQKQEMVKRIAAPDIRARKGGEPIVCLTAYDAPTAALLDDHCDLLLVGDSVGMVVHGMPNTVGVIVVNATLLMSAVILLETSLSYLGFGITAPDISLGQIISEYNEAFKTRPWLFWWPGLFIVIIALCINFIGDGLRDAFDPRQRRVPNKGGAWSEFVTFVKNFLPGVRPASVVDASDERKER